VSIFERLDPSEECKWYGQPARSPYKLDFLYFYMGSHNLVTKEYFSETYLTSLKNDWGIQKKIQPFDGEASKYKNAWYFEEYSIDDFLACSSKIELSKFLQQIDAYRHEVFITNKAPLRNDNTWYVKSDHGFSGRGNFLLNPQETGKDFDVIAVIEQYLNRVIDFAITILDDDVTIIYKNQVSRGGQYLGTMIDHSNDQDIEKFLSQNRISQSEINRFMMNFEKIKTYFTKVLHGKKIIGSFDFFIYQKNNEFLIHPCCEYNPRWTMGRVAWHISQYPKIKGFKKFSTLFHKDIQKNYQLLSPFDYKIKFQYQGES